MKWLALCWMNKHYCVEPSSAIRPPLIQWLQHVKQPKCGNDLYLVPMAPYTYSFTSMLFTDFMEQWKLSDPINLLPLPDYKGAHSSVNTMTRLLPGQMENWGLIPSMGEDYFLHHCIHCSGVHQASYPMSCSGSYPGMTGVSCQPHFKLVLKVKKDWSPLQEGKSSVSCSDNLYLPLD